MHSDAVRKGAGQPVDFEDVGEELAQFECFVGHLFELGRMTEHFFVVMPHHRDAAAGGRDDVVVGSEYLQEPLRQWPGVVVQAGVGHGLAAAGLLFGIFDLQSLPFEQFKRGQAYLWVELVDVAGNEQADAHSSIVECRRLAPRSLCLAEREVLHSLVDWRSPPNTISGMTTAYIAIDLGAESGRVIVGVLENERLRLEEVHRFLHESVWLPTGLHWNITGIWREIVVGLRKAADWGRANRVELVSVGVDTWGVDWALVDKAGELVGTPHAYRDPRNAAAYDAVVAKLGAERIYRTTGIQFMALNSLYSLYAHQARRSASGCRGRSAVVHSRFASLLAERRADHGSDDRFDQPNDRLPHGRLGSRDGRGTGTADEHPGTDHVARDRHRQAAFDSLPKRPVCRPDCKLSRRVRTTRRAPLRRCRQQDGFQLVLFVERHVVAAGRGA